MSDRANELRNMVGLLTENDLMTMLGVSDHTLQSWRVQGSGPKFTKLGKTIFYRVLDVTEWINANVHVRTATSSDAA